MLVYLFDAPLWYGNAQYVVGRILQLIDESRGPAQAVVIDANAVSDVDYTGLRALRGLVARLHQRDIELALARASHLVHHDLKHGALLEELGADRLFPSVAEAVSAVQARR